MKLAYGVSSVGLGHARRSLTLARYLRKARNDLEITWFCAEPVISFLEQEGEKIPSVCRQLRSLSSIMEDRVSSGRLKDMSLVARTSSTIARQNYSFLSKELSDYDFLVQDEFVETLLAFMWEKPSVLPTHKAVVTDFLELSSPGSWNPLSQDCKLVRKPHAIESLPPLVILAFLQMKLILFRNQHVIEQRNLSPSLVPFFRILLKNHKVL